MMAHSQVNLQTTDTIVGRANRFYYLPQWYDDCYMYEMDTVGFKGTNLFQHETYPTTSFDYVIAEEHYTPQWLTVKGLAAMVSINLGGGTAANPPANPWRGMEKMYLMQSDSLCPTLSAYDYPRRMHVLDSVRWDTAAPKLMRLPVNAFSTPSDSTGYVDCYVYEVLFELPREVHDTFYIIGTFRSNIIDTSEAYFQVFRYIPTSYMAIWSQSIDCERCPVGPKLFVASESDLRRGWNAWILDNRLQSTYGPFLPIIESYSLEASASPVTGGTIKGTGRFPRGWQLQLTAVPTEDFAFSHWSDGATENPRLINLGADTNLTAIFLPR